MTKSNSKVGPSSKNQYNGPKSELVMSRDKLCLVRESILGKYKKDLRAWTWWLNDLIKPFNTSELEVI